MTEQDNPYIYSYTSQQAIEDGMLHVLRGPHLVTVALLYKQPRTKEVFDVNKLNETLAHVLKLAKANPNETLFTKLPDCGGERVWASKNEMGGWTLMLPSDY